MSDNFINSFGNVTLDPDNYGVWNFAVDFDVPDTTNVGTPANVLPFDIPIEGALTGMSQGVFTAPTKGIYYAQWFGLGVTTDNGAGNERVAQIIKNNDKFQGGADNDYNIFLGASPRFSVSAVFSLSVGSTLLGGIRQDSGAVLSIDEVNCTMTIIKLFSFN